ncbi:MAG: 50S ribosomal protein L3 [Gammaproteobacteria bacterium]|nr:50S ribosomal protein L3 [Gammaproteobacteria bacterium]MDE0252411.1 50S ribosomal protein L3 [Gammaproteobacteria bacterium]MDE0402480.1 50S ribosomal protein L3 [Gammaproteobacteria bacterium]
MTIGIVGIKCGMTRVFDSSGESIPVTVVHAEPNKITQRKTVENDRYEAVQVGHGERVSQSEKRRQNKPLGGHLAKSKAMQITGLTEFRLDRYAVDATNVEHDLGVELSVDQFFKGQFVDVTGTSKGKGFAGVIKRWNFQRQDMTHGNSLSHRTAGAIGQCQTPGRVFKGKKMAGHLGAERVTVQNLQIVGVDTERSLLMIKGGLPGADGSVVVVRPAIKKGIQTPAASDE